MPITEEQSRTLLAKYGVYVTEVCDKCGKILGHVRFTRYGEPGAWCCRECRDGVAVAERHRATRKGGRLQKHQTDRERRIAEGQQARSEWRSGGRPEHGLPDQRNGRPAIAEELIVKIVPGTAAAAGGSPVVTQFSDH